MRLLRFAPSLRQKITLAYFAIAALVLGGSLFTFEELKSVEEKILLGERISEIFDATLEVRRFERNYFLHGQISDYRENVRYADQLHILLERSGSDFATIGAPQNIETLRSGLEKYRRLMEAYVRASREHLMPDGTLELQVRTVGKEIVSIVENAVSTERRLTQTSLASLRKILVFSIVGVALLMIAVGQALSRMVVRPLRQMENNVDAVSSGKRNKLLLPSNDREIVAITTAFNNMLRELELRQKYLLRSEKLASMGTMLSGVAHELNNPLSNIWSSCQILMEEIEESDLDSKKELLRQIDEQSIRARNIVRSLLDFARDQQFRSEPLPLRNVVEQTVRFIKSGIPASVTVAINIPEDIVIFADKQRLQQAFLNLIKNAVEATTEGGTVAVSAEKCAPGVGDEDDAMFLPGCNIDGDAVDITIKDDGHGIAPEIVPRIFDPFFTTKDVGRGMGLGLFIVYQIIDEHGGCISVNSRIGEGTTFLIRLPLRNAMATDVSAS